MLHARVKKNFSFGCGLHPTFRQQLGHDERETGALRQDRSRAAVCRGQNPLAARSSPGLTAEELVAFTLLLRPHRLRIPRLRSLHKLQELLVAFVPLSGILVDEDDALVGKTELDIADLPT